MFVFHECLQMLNDYDFIYAIKIIQSINDLTNKKYFWFIS